MQLEVPVEKLRKNKLFVATPMYGGNAHGMYVKSCLDLQSICSQYGIEVRFSFIFNESLITRARNYLVDEFLRAEGDRKSTRLNSSHSQQSRMPSSA